MQVLVSGGAGVLGSRLAKGLADRGHRVRVLTLPGDPNVARLRDVPCETVFGDIAEESSLDGLFDGIDTVFHLAAVILAPDRETLRRINVEGTRHMVRGAVAEGVKHFVYVSSTSAAWPEGSDYAQSKYDAETIVKGQPAMAWTVVRPTLIYGRDEGQEFMLFMDYLRRWPVVPFIGRGVARKSPVLADDVVSGLLAVAGNSRTRGRTYDLGGGETITIREMARLMLECQGLRKAILPIPVPLCRVAAWGMERTMKRPPLTRYAISRILHDAAPDLSAARADLDYHPSGVTEGLRRCYGAVARPPSA